MELLKLLQQLCLAAGKDCFVVGGAVRDRLLNIETNEYDLVTSLPPSQLWETARSQGINAFWLDEERGMLRLSDGAAAVDLSPLQTSLIQDLRRRDFTINAIGQPLAEFLAGKTSLLIDPLGGCDDLANRCLRPVERGSMVADPVRVLRGIRLLISRELRLAEGSAELLRNAVRFLTNVPAERISQELGRILTSANAPAGVDYLQHLGVVEQILPEVAAMRGVTQNKYHLYTVDDHSSKAFAAYVDIVHNATFLNEQSAGWVTGYWSDLSEQSRYAIMLAAWLHDIGKPPTRQVRADKVTFYGHELAGAEMSRAIATRLKLSSEQSSLLAGFIKFHMYPMQLWRSGRLDDRLLHRYYHRTGAAGVPVVLFTLADHLAKGEDVANSEQFAEHRRVVEQFLVAWFERQAEIVSPQPLLRGDQIAGMLGRSPGPWLRKAKELLLEAQAAKQVTDRVTAEKYLRKIGHEIDQAHGRK